MKGDMSLPGVGLVGTTSICWKTGHVMSNTAQSKPSYMAASRELAPIQTAWSMGREAWVCMHPSV